MSRVLIVDDDVWARSHIRDSVNWSEFDLEVIGEASSGWEAMDMAMLWKPDIVISDVRMPEIDGIELSSRLFRRVPYMKFIFVSSFSDFSLVKGAIREGAVDYILKPVNHDEMALALGRAMERITNTRKEVENQLLVDSFNNLPASVRGKYFLDLIYSSGLEFDESTVERLFVWFNADFVLTGPFCVWSLITQALDIEVVLAGAARGLNTRYVVFEKSINQQNGYVVIIDNEHPFEVKTLLERIAKSTHCGIYIGVGSACTGWRMVADSYWEAEYALHVLCKTKGSDSAVSVGEYSEFRPSKSSLVDSAMTYIGHHYNDDITLNSLSEYLHVNASYLSRLFKRDTGSNFVDYILSVRMEKARDLLFSTHLNIQEIATMVGIDNSNYFSISFKKYFGHSPSDFKRLYQA